MAASSDRSGLLWLAAAATAVCGTGSTTSIVVVEIADESGARVSRQELVGGQRPAPCCLQARPPRPRPLEPLFAATHGPAG
jgi:hypothetical protein